MHLDFLAQPPLKADAVAVADDQHPDHKLGINRRPANVSIKRCQLLPKLTQYLRHDRINPTQKMASWDAPFQVKQVKQLALIASPSTHHDKPPPPDASSARNHCSPKNHEPFFNSIGHERKSTEVSGPSAKTLKAD
jgi:hypothetical protein